LQGKTKVNYIWKPRKYTHTLQGKTKEKSLRSSLQRVRLCTRTVWRSKIKVSKWGSEPREASPLIHVSDRVKCIWWLMCHLESAVKERHIVRVWSAIKGCAPERVRRIWWLLHCSESALRERRIAGVVIVNSKPVANEVVSVTMRLRVSRWGSQVFKDVRRCSWRFAKCSKVFEGVRKVFASVDGYSWMFANVCKCLQVFVDVCRWSLMILNPETHTKPNRKGFKCFNTSPRKGARWY
jgi:hypothetical protein